MTLTTPLAFRWDGDAFVPLHKRAADRTLIVDRNYWLVEAKSQEYSGQSWRHMWAVIGKAHDSLPEGSKQYADADAFRKDLLIIAGFYNETSIEVGDAATAGRIVTSLRRQDALSHVRIQGSFVYQRTAKSMKDMGKEEFENAKRAIIELAAERIGVTVDELTKQGE